MDQQNRHVDQQTRRDDAGMGNMTPQAEEKVQSEQEGSRAQGPKADGSPCFTFRPAMLCDGAMSSCPYLLCEFGQ